MTIYTHHIPVRICSALLHLSSALENRSAEGSRAGRATTCGGKLCLESLQSCDNQTVFEDDCFTNRTRDNSFCTVSFASCFALCWLHCRALSRSSREIYPATDLARDEKCHRFQFPKCCENFFHWSTAYLLPNVNTK